MNEGKYFLKYIINISILIRFKQYFPSIIQPVEFTGRVARQNNGLYVLRMIVKLAYIANVLHSTALASTSGYCSRELKRNLKVVCYSYQN